MMIDFAGVNSEKAWGQPAESKIPSSDQVAFFKRNGYAVLSGFTSEPALSQIKKTLLILLKKYSPHLFSEFEDGDFLEDKIFNERLLAFRKHKPELFGAIYDCMQASASLQGFFTSQNTIECVASFLHNDMPSIMSFNQVLRMDAPSDTRNSLDWHQDLISLDKKPDVSDGVTISVALHPISSHNGSLMVCPGSHLEGWVTDVISKTESTSRRHNDENTPTEHHTNYSNIYVVEQSILESPVFSPSFGVSR